MLPDDTRRKIENITKGIILDGALDNCTSVRNHLSAGFETSTTVKTDFESKSIIKKEQATVLEAYCDQYNLWVTDLLGEDRYLTRGGEAEVYLELAPVSHVAHGKFFGKFSKSHQWKIRRNSEINLPCCFIATFICKSMLTYHLCISEMMFKLTPCINCSSSRC